MDARNHRRLGLPSSSHSTQRSRKTGPSSILSLESNISTKNDTECGASGKVSPWESLNPLNGPPSYHSYLHSLAGCSRISALRI